MRQPRPSRSGPAPIGGISTGPSPRSVRFFKNFILGGGTKGSLCSRRQGSSPAESMVGNPLRERGEWVLAVIRDVLMPDVTRRNRLASEIIAFVDELEQAGVLTQTVLPALLKYRPDRASVS